ncbi:hypothetical protein AC249_AIPGENE10371 [Exaiptasia diaphana]|nr:hypothetical protein AC249_AIPGENE10371 [Exaiptasia diaphana]
MLDAKIVQLKRSGKETSEYKPPIESEDLVKIKTSEALSISNPVSLLRNVWFHVVLFFCRRGREGQRQLKTTSFKFEKDAAGRNYITMTHDEITKNHPGGLKDVSSTEKLARIYETEHVDGGYKAIQIIPGRIGPLAASLITGTNRVLPTTMRGHRAHSFNIAATF